MVAKDGKGFLELFKQRASFLGRAVTGIAGGVHGGDGYCRREWFHELTTMPLCGSIPQENWLRRVSLRMLSPAKEFAVRGVIQLRGIGVFTFRVKDGSWLKTMKKW